MEKRKAYCSPEMKEISLAMENVLSKSQEFPELPDHDWITPRQVDVFPQEESKK